MAEAAAPALDQNALPRIVSNCAVSGKVRPRLLLLAGFISEVAIFAALVTDTTNTAWYLILHVSICLSTWLAWRLQVSKTDLCDQSAQATTLLVGILLAGPFGVLTAAAFLIPQARQVETTATLSAVALVEPQQQSRVEQLCVELLDHRLRISGTKKTQPLIDVITEGTQKDKFEALSLMAKQFEPEMAPALRRALADPSAPVRVLAAAVTSKLLAQFQTRVAAAEAKAVNNPGIAQNWRQLAATRLQLCVSGLLDTGPALAEWQQRNIDLSRALAIEPQKPATKDKGLSCKIVSTFA
jgi:hypothetical protein